MNQCRHLSNEPSRSREISLVAPSLQLYHARNYIRAAAVSRYGPRLFRVSAPCRLYTASVVVFNLVRRALSPLDRVPPTVAQCFFPQCSISRFPHVRQPRPPR